MELAALFTLLAIAIGLAMDSMAVSLGVGASGEAPDIRSKLRLAFHLGLFQGGLTAVGWLIGATIANLIGNVDHWIAMALLSYVGIRMVMSGLSPSDERYNHPNATKGLTLVMLSVATSIDAMAVGLSMAMLGDPVLLPSLVIGLVTFTLSLLALMLGNRLNNTFGKRLEVVGGVILIVIGLRILVDHLQ
jgi:putative Mn2+ efflux pump MntP